jgi:hypothetical protein
MLIAIRKSFAAKLELIAEVVGLAVSFSGATLAAVFGKLVIAIILGAITLGLFLRLTGRRSNLQVAAQPVPGWVRPAAVLLAVVETSALVEATNLPVRFSQQGFLYTHWLLVALVLAAAYLVQVKLFSSLAARHHARQAL